MKQSDRDLLLQRQVETGERNVELLTRQVEVMEDQARASRDLVHAPQRRLQQEKIDAAYPPLRLLFGGQRGAVGLLRSIPGFASLWTQSVPEEYLVNVFDRAGEEWWIISCPCNERPLVQTGGLADCLCGRWFFATGSTVRVKRFPVSCSDE
jgi:hypothetical protein